MDTEAQRGKVICPRPHSSEAVGQANLTLSCEFFSVMLRAAGCLSGRVTRAPHTTVSHTWLWKEEERKL